MDEKEKAKQHIIKYYEVHGNRLDEELPDEVHDIVAFAIAQDRKEREKSAPSIRAAAEEELQERIKQNVDEYLKQKHFARWSNTTKSYIRQYIHTAMMFATRREVKRERERCEQAITKAYKSHMRLEDLIRVIRRQGGK
jgi:hypothetical protein